MRTDHRDGWLRRDFAPPEQFVIVLMQESFTVVYRIGEHGARRRLVVAHGTSVAAFLRQINDNEHRSDLRWVFRAYQRLDDEDIVDENYKQDQLLELFADFPFRRGIRASPAMAKLPLLLRRVSGTANDVRWAERQLIS